VAELADCLSFIDAALPSKNVDEATGERRTAVYASLLGSYSTDALAFMAREACRTLDWFPTPRQCLDLIAGYRPPVSDQEMALRLCSDFTQTQLERWLDNVRDGQPLGDVPDQWLRIAVERGHVRRLDDGSYVSRASYHTCLRAA
jgi:hypothetical protein